MKQFAAIFLTLALLVTPLLVIGAVKSAPVSPGKAVTFQAIPLFPGRDEADEDSIYYSYGFEDGFGDWTTADLTDAGSMWRNSEDHAFEGSSWWCHDPELEGYGDHWLQYLVTPAIDLSDQNAAVLRFQVFWSVENPAIGGPPQAPYDGWDGCNVWASRDGGRNWQVIQPVTPRYTHNSLYSFGEEWGLGANIPGWCANSGGQAWPVGEWVAAEFNLQNFVGARDVRIRWAFCSDPMWCTGDANGDADGQAIGFLVDNMQVVSGQNVLWSNNGDAQEGMTFDRPEGSGDFWEISNQVRHTGRSSAHCPVQSMLRDALISPPLDILPAPWYTYFEFWVRCDTRMPLGPDSLDNSLDDLFDVECSTDGARWDRIIYDYARDNTWMNSFKYYGPETHFNTPPDLPEWKWKLNLTQFAGQTIYLRWRMITDDAMDNPQGTGLYIDDFALRIIDRPEHDVGIDTLHIPYPTALRLDKNARVVVRNWGMAGEERVEKHYWFDHGVNQTPIVPWESLIADTSIAYTPRISGRYPYADSVSITAFTVLPADQNHANDAKTVEGLVIYPENIWVLGYDGRTYQFRYPALESGSGPMVKYTPRDDGVVAAFDVKAIRVRWDGSQQDVAETQLHIFADNNGVPGQELHTARIQVEQANLLPYEHVIDVSTEGALRNLRANFWVWFELLREDGYPSIIGDTRRFGAGHYFNYIDG
ncbi:MAG: hypothetical protein V2A61_04725, partial [Calditrichota bacterium]